jgi:hypothetical protein
MRKSRDRPHLDIVRVKVLLGDAVTDHDHPIPVAKEEVLA